MRIILKPGGLLAAVALLVVIIVVVYTLGQEKSRRTVASGGSVPTGINPSPRQGGGQAGNLFKEGGWKFYTEKSAVATQMPLTGAESPAQPAYRFVITKVGREEWNVGFNQKLTGISFAKGKKVRFSLWARTTAGSALTLIMQRDAPPFPHCWKDYVRPTTEWKRYTYEFQTDDYGDGQALVNCFLGAQEGTVELAGLTLERVN